MKHTDMEKEFKREIRALKSLQYDNGEPPPDINKLRLLVQEVKSEKRRAERLSFALFACTASLILVGLCFAFLTFSAAFAIIQIGSLLPLPFVAIRARKKVNKA